MWGNQNSHTFLTQSTWPHYICFEKPTVSYKVKHTTNLWPSNSAPGKYSRKRTICGIHTKTYTWMLTATLLRINTGNNTDQCMSVQWTTQQGKGTNYWLTNNIMCKGSQPQRRTFSIVVCMPSSRTGHINLWWQKSVPRVACGRQGAQGNPYSRGGGHIGAHMSGRVH